MQDEKLPSRVEEILATARAARTACENELTAEILKSFKCIMDSPDTGIHLADNTFEDRLTDLSSLGLDIPRETAQHIRAFFCGHNGKEAVSALQTWMNDRKPSPRADALKAELLGDAVMPGPGL